MINHITTDEEIARSLCNSVRAATPHGMPESYVRTLITRPLWRRFLRFLSVSEPMIHQNMEPTGAIGKGTVRVYGSETIVVESDRELAVSFPIK